jgi:hypothetical protein
MSVPHDVRSAARSAALIAALLAGMMAHANDDDWYGVVKGAEHVFEVRHGSFALEKGESGEKMAAMIFRRRSIKSEPGSEILLKRYTVAMSDCSRGYGTIISHKLTGEFDFKIEWVNSGGSAASFIAEWICEQAEDPSVSSASRSNTPGALATRGKPENIRSERGSEAAGLPAIKW